MATVPERQPVVAPSPDPKPIMDVEKLAVSDRLSMSASVNNEQNHRKTELEKKDLESTTIRRPNVPKAGLQPVPDGGIQAWLQVLGSYMLFFNTW